MEPIINPWVFYLIDKVDSWLVVFELMTVVVGIAFGVFFILEKACEFDKYEEDNFVRFKNIRKPLMKMFVPLLILAILTPSSSTIYKMIVADNVTPNNIQIVGDTVEDGIDYIFDKINEVVVEEMEER